MQTSIVRLKATIAKESDQPLVIRLCRRAVGPSDYILRILPNTIAHGGLFLAWDGVELVGMTNFEKCLDGGGWLSMARTDPAWRRRGVAIFLQRQIADHAKRKRITPLRLWTASKNKASIRACEKGGFKQVCEAAHISCRIRVKRKRKPIPPSSLSNSQLRSLLTSSYLTKMNGYVAREWHFMKATERLLKRLERQGELYAADDSTLLATRPERRFKEPQSSLTILTGYVPKSMQNAKEIAGALGAKILSSYVPFERYQLSVAKKLGFKRSPWGKHCLVFEKIV